MHSEPRSIVIVGASSAGLTCASRLKRLQPRWKVQVVEARSLFSYGACGLPYALSGGVERPGELRETYDGFVRDERYFAEEKGIEILSGWRVTSIVADKRQIVLESPDGEGSREMRYDELVIATGAHARRLHNQPEHPRVHAFHVWDDLEPLYGQLSRREVGSVAIIGGGLVGMELAESVRRGYGIEVAVFDRFDTPLGRMLDPEVGALVARHVEEHGVRFYGDHEVLAIEPGLKGVTLRSRRGRHRTEAVIVAAGVEPAVEIAQRAGAAIGRSGAIAVSERMGTSLPHIHAIGDCVEVRLASTGRTEHMPAGSLAMRQGRTLGNVLAGVEDRFPAVAGAVATRVFDWNVAVVGCGEREANRKEVVHRSVWISADDRPHFWPGARKLFMKLTYDPSTRRILGLQAVGPGDAVRRVDALTPLICRFATIDDLPHIEHAYAPPYAPPVDPLNQLGHLAQNQEEGVVALSPVAELRGQQILDVRPRRARVEHPSHFDATIEHEVGEINAVLEELPDDLAVVCGSGARSYAVARRLGESGRRARYLGGGLAWRAGTGAPLASGAIVTRSFLREG